MSPTLAFYLSKSIDEATKTELPFSANIIGKFDLLPWEIQVSFQFGEIQNYCHYLKVTVHFILKSCSI